MRSWWVLCTDSTLHAWTFKQNGFHTLHTQLLEQHLIQHILLFTHYTPAAWKARPRHYKGVCLFPSSTMTPVWEKNKSNYPVFSKWSRVPFRVWFFSSFLTTVTVVCSFRHIYIYICIIYITQAALWQNTLLRALYKLKCIDWLIYWWHSR